MDTTRLKYYNKLNYFCFVCRVKKLLYVFFFLNYIFTDLNIFNAHIIIDNLSNLPAIIITTSMFFFLTFFEFTRTTAVSNFCLPWEFNGRNTTRTFHNNLTLENNMQWHRHTLIASVNVYVCACVFICIFTIR